MTERKKPPDSFKSMAAAFALQNVYIQLVPYPRPTMPEIEYESSYTGDGGKKSRIIWPYQ